MMEQIITFHVENIINDKTMTIDMDKFNEISKTIKGMGVPEWNAFDEKKPTIMHFEKDAEEEPLMIDELMKFRMEYSLKAFSEWEEKGRTIEYARYNAV